MITGVRKKFGAGLTVLSRGWPWRVSNPPQVKNLPHKKHLPYIVLIAILLAACHKPVALPTDLFPKDAAGGWHLTAVRDLPASESPDPVPRDVIDRIVAASYEGPGKLDARVYALSASAVAFGLAQRWRPSADTVFFDKGPFFVVIRWQSADRKLLQEFVADLEKRLAAANGGKK